MTNEIWDLDSIFSGGSESAELYQFLTELTEAFDALEGTSPLPTLGPDGYAAWVSRINGMYDVGARLHQASSFIGCLESQDVKDDKAVQLAGQADDLSARLGTLWTQLSAIFAEQADDAWAQFLAETDLQPMSYHLNEQRNRARQKMSPQLEILANELATDGYHAWDRLYQSISGDKEPHWEGQPISLGQLQQKYMDAPDRETRRGAYETYHTAWQDLAKSCALALNFQAGFRLTLYKHRGWQSVLQEPLLNNRLTQATLDAMWGVVDAKSAKLLDYFEAKARLFGIDQLAWYDTVAPVGETSREFTYQEAGDFVVDSIRTFNPNIADYCRMAIDQRWIEAENRTGKRAGAYCTSLPLSKESRIFMTYTGSYNGLLTLAHELGHGYHSWVMRDLPYGKKRYTMSVAETASTFNELLVNDAGVRSATSRDEKLPILAAKLNDATAFLMNIRARYDFERAFFDRRAKGMLTVDELSELMVSAQKTAYKDGLSSYAPLFWASKLHFYITRAPFYNFPYTFGYLFSNGVYAQAMAEGDAFVQRYIDLLRDTGAMDTEQLARTHLGVDLTQPEFWEQAVDRVLADVDIFVELVD